MLRELLGNPEILGFPVHKSEAVIFPDNHASQRAFEKAGFYHHHSYEDGAALIYVYEQ
jgi:RimJ/RimL family protein N-acetyltransferase